MVSLGYGGRRREAEFADGGMPMEASGSPYEVLRGSVTDAFTA